MKLVTAVIRPEKLDDVKEALADAGYPSITVTDVKGRGKQKGLEQTWRGETYRVDLLHKTKLDIAIGDDEVDDVVETIRKSAETGSIGDGKVFVTPVEEAVRIRTGETGTEAL